MISRREFLKLSSVGVTALYLGYPLQSNAQKKEEVKPMQYTAKDLSLIHI